MTGGAGRDPVPVKDLVSGQTTSTQFSAYNPEDPLGYGQHRRENVSKKQMKIDHPEGNKRKLKKYYTRQNKLIDQFLGAEDEEQKQIEDDIRYKPRIKFAVRASFIVNFCLFIIQMYAAISTGSLSVRHFWPRLSGSPILLTGASFLQLPPMPSWISCHPS